VQGGGLYSINADPMFYNPSSGDYHLNFGSLSVDSGDNGVTGKPETDKDGNPRVWDSNGFGAPVIDMGCYETVTLHVPSTQYPDIQSAIIAAKNKMMVLVDAGTYVENIDFMGKAITLKSKYGPIVTILDGNQTVSVVSFTNNEGANSILDGFTITNGKADQGGGIHCNGTSPSIINNLIQHNIANVIGGGVFCKDSSALLANNCISSNTGTALGGGVGVENSSILVSHNTLHNNQATVGAGVYSDTLSSTAITNSILWENGAQEIGGPGIHTVSHSDVKGGYPGLNNINLDPLFIEPGFGDYHIKYTSPCKGTGDPTAEGSLPYDIDGNPRQEEGDLSVDMGADEFYRHYYWIGNFTANGDIRVRMVGAPGSGSINFYGYAFLQTPLWTPYGYWQLNNMINLLPTLPTANDGYFTMLGKIPSTPPKIKLPTQSFIGTSLQNMTTTKSFLVHLE